MNRITTSLAQDKKLLSIYFTAGFPKLEDTVSVLEQLQQAGVDMIELGLPFSDPLADGPTIQESSTQALRNGMTTDKLFSQLQGVRENVHLPLIVMGYFNPMMHDVFNNMRKALVVFLGQKRFVIFFTPQGNTTCPLSHVPSKLLTKLHQQLACLVRHQLRLKLVTAILKVAQAHWITTMGIFLETLLFLEIL